jgi:hypothetical protein
VRNPQIGDLVAIEGGKHAAKIGRYVRNDLIQSGQERLYPVVKLDDGTEVRVASVVVADPEECCDRGPRTAPPGERWHDLLCPVGKGGRHDAVLARMDTRPSVSEGGADRG